MLLTLQVSALRHRIGSGPGKLALTDVPTFAREQLGVNGLVLSTDLLVGADRPLLQRVLESADKAGCPCLVLMETNPQPFGDADVMKVQVATERCLRVAQAAAWLGCSAFSVPVASPDDEPSLITSAMNLKPLSRRAEKLDLNLCIAPMAGLTLSPERVTELLKKIGGFRVGTLPDFAAAAASGDPILYLRRLVPYASAVLVPVHDGDPALPLVQSTPAAPPDEPKPKRSKKADADAPAPSAAPGPKKRTSKKKGSADPADEPDPGAPASKPAPSAAQAAKRGALAAGAYDLHNFMQVLVAVGYEGPVALDYRGTGDPMPALLRTRDALAKALGPATPEADEDDPMAALLAAVSKAGEGDELDDDEEAEPEPAEDADEK
jgi:sugar phosphate isomerase/epimerase